MINCNPNYFNRHGQAALHILYMIGQLGYDLGYPSTKYLIHPPLTPFIPCPCHASSFSFLPCQFCKLGCKRQTHNSALHSCFRIEGLAMARKLDFYFCWNIVVLILFAIFLYYFISMLQSTVSSFSADMPGLFLCSECPSMDCITAKPRTIPVLLAVALSKYTLSFLTVHTFNLFISAYKHLNGKRSQIRPSWPYDLIPEPTTIFKVHNV